MKNREFLVKIGGKNYAENFFRAKRKHLDGFYGDFYVKDILVN